MINNLYEEKTMQLVMYKDGQLVDGSSDDIKLIIFGDEKAKFMEVNFVQNGYKYKFSAKAYEIEKIEN